MTEAKPPADLFEAVEALCWAYRARLAAGQSGLPMKALVDAFKHDMSLTGKSGPEYTAAAKLLEQLAAGDVDELANSVQLVRPKSVTADLRRPKH